MATITTDDAAAYLARWRLVQQAEVAELRCTPMATKLCQLAALVAARDLFPAEPDRDVQAEEVRIRWARLRQALSD
ncbi:MAG: hypothetical protein IPG25_15170 [Proteobacteria bacterium]|nr:hypothetical protein [Pseudomonadota bacterium]